MPLGFCFTTGSASPGEGLFLLDSAPPGEGLFLLDSASQGEGLFVLVHVAGGDCTLSPSSEGESGLGSSRRPLFSNTLLYT